MPGPLDEAFLEGLARRLALKGMELEALRQRTLLRMGLALLLGLPLFLLALRHGDEGGALPSAVGTLLLLVLGLLYAPFRRAFKGVLVPPLAEALGLRYGVERSPGEASRPAPDEGGNRLGPFRVRVAGEAQRGEAQGRDAVGFTASGLFPKPDRLEVEDYLEGPLGAFHLRSADVRAYRRVRTKNGTRYQRFFSGVFVRLELPFTAPAEVVVPQRLPEALGFLKGARGGLQRLNLESPEFERRFDAYADDQVGGRVFLTPAVMEGLLGYAERTRKTPYLALRGTTLYLAVPGVDRFEPRLFRPIDGKVLREYLERFLREMELALALAEDLRLEERRRRLGG